MKVIAFYLPQFHTTPENDKWWGKGFTEWKNMKSAKPLFNGHYQPRVPLNNNYYDLSNTETLKWQTKIAKKYGIHGFCCYHYWSAGKMLLQKPMEMYLNDKDCDLPFCFSWANETWTNAWAVGKGAERKVLWKQEYGEEEEWEQHFNYLLPFFKDSRYMKEDNKPLMVIYRPQYITDLNRRLAYYNRRACEEGFDGMIFASQDVSFYLEKDINKTQFKYQIEYQPRYAFYDMSSWIGKKKDILWAKAQAWVRDHFRSFRSIKREKLDICSYDDVWHAVLNRKPEVGCIPGAFTDWDNTPRYKKRGKVLTGASPDKFRKYFEKQLIRARDEYKSDYIFIFAWNEWCEGGYLEADEKYKYGYLEAIKNSLDNFEREW